MQANVDFVEKDNVDIGVGVSNGAVGTTITPMVHDFIIASVFSVFEGLFNILIGVTSSSYNVPIASIDRQKSILQVFIVGFKDQKKNVVQVPKSAIGGFGFEMDSEGA
jgi:hypothetical protein